MLPRLHRAFPELKLYIREELPDALPRALESGALDVVITLLPVNHAELVAQSLFREPLFLVVARGSSLAERRAVTRQDLAGQDVLALARGQQLHEVVHALCQECGARLRYDFEGTSLDTLREMVVMGLGVTFLPGLYVRREIFADPNVKVLLCKAAPCTGTSASSGANRACCRPATRTSRTSSAVRSRTSSHRSTRRLASHPA